MGNVFDVIFGSRKVDVLPDPPGFDDPDALSGLTPREIKLIRDSWDLVKKDIKAIGITFFVKYFGKYPKYKKYFKAFKDVPLEELPQSKKLQAHANSVMYTLMSLIDSLDDPETLVVSLHKIGENHSKRNITEQAFHDLKSVLMDLFSELLGSKLTENAAKAWDKMLTTAFKVVFQTLHAPIENK